jgi:Sulfotransferase family
VDLRLAWLRAKFPAAKILHLFRHPRDQWCSSLRSAASRPIPSSLREFKQFDQFYLLLWNRDLRRDFPFLTLEEHLHPYELFYQVWKLSYLFGRFHAHYSVAFEEFIGDPRGAIRKVLDALGIGDYDLDMLAGLVSPVPLGAWRQSPDAERFESIEARVDANFAHHAAQLGANALPR